MKNTFKSILFSLSALWMLSSCEDELVKPVLADGAAPVVNVSVQTLVLNKDNAEQNAVTISWSKPDFGFNAGASYNLKIDKKGGDFSQGINIGMGQALSKTYKVKELNNLLLGLGMAPGTAADLDIKVEAVLGQSTVLSSPIISMKATAYQDKLDLSSPWGLVGSATVNGWNGPDMPFFKTVVPNVFVAYVTLIDGEIKIRKNNDWGENYGGSNGKLNAGGDNIAVTAGTYQITFDAANLTYKIEKLTWGIVGSATVNSWNGPDMPLTYDPSSDTWRALVMLNEGEIKFRKNNDWSVNFGDSGANGTLDAGGDNIVVKKGSYLITVDFNKNTYTIEAKKILGIVGSATPNSWDGPDTKFNLDFTKEGVWYLNGMVLKAGEIKFRENDDWTVNYGDDGANGTLEAGGANIAVSAGTYDITLDFSNPASPTYKMVKR
ncbi:MAG: SusE domain-containing protein [Spirosomataceae bacterium]